MESASLSSTPRGRAWANTTAAAASSPLRCRSTGPVVSNPRVYQAPLSTRASVSSTAHPGSWPSPRTPAWNHSPASENRLILRFLLTGLQPGPGIGRLPVGGRLGSAVLEEISGQFPDIVELLAGLGPGWQWIKLKRDLRTELADTADL